MLERGQEVWFHDRSGTYLGYVEKTNRHTVNVLVNDDCKREGYQLWRVTEYFLSPSPEVAVERWNDYRNRLQEFKIALEERRKIFEYRKCQEVIIEPLNGFPYTATILSVDRITLVVHTEDNKFKRVDKAISRPLDVYSS